MDTRRLLLGAVAAMSMGLSAGDVMGGLRQTPRHRHGASRVSAPNNDKKRTKPFKGSKAAKRAARRHK